MQIGGGDGVQIKEKAVLVAVSGGHSWRGFQAVVLEPVFALTGNRASDRVTVNERRAAICCSPPVARDRCGTLRICGFHLLINLFVAQAAKHAYSNDCFVGSCRGFVMPAFSHKGMSYDRRHEDNPQLTVGELRGQAPCLKPHEGVNNG